PRTGAGPARPRLDAARRAGRVLEPPPHRGRRRLRVRHTAHRPVGLRLLGLARHAARADRALRSRLVRPAQPVAAHRLDRGDAHRSRLLRLRHQEADGPLDPRPGLRPDADGRRRLARISARGSAATDPRLRPRAPRLELKGETMKIWQRIQLVMKGRINEALDHLEDPERSLNQLVHDMEEELDAAKRAVAAAMANEDRLRAQIAFHTEDAGEWQRAAERALGKGDEAGAREALRRVEMADRQRQK